MKDFHFFVTNDDGIHSLGIKVLAEALSQFGQVTVCCPDGERSGFSHSVTVNEPLIINKIEGDFLAGIEVFTINGSPADTVKLGLQLLFPNKKPDFIFSGINAGLNVGHDSYYSGTVGAGREGVVNGIPSVAMSMERRPKSEVAFGNLGKNLNKVIGFFLKQNFPKNLVMNVNFPHVDSLDEDLEIEVVPTDYDTPKFTYLENPHPLTDVGYYLYNDFYHVNPIPNTDIHTVRQGRIAVTPIQVKPDVSDFISDIQTWFE